MGEYEEPSWIAFHANSELDGKLRQPVSRVLLNLLRL